MKLRSRYLLLASTAILAALGTTLVVVNAASAGATIKIGPTATLANPPNSVLVTVDYSCLPSQFSFGEVQVDQAQSGPPASGSRTDVFGFGSFQPTCDDKDHRAVVIVTAFSGSFTKGTAGASAFIDSGAIFANASNEISIR